MGVHLKHVNATNKILLNHSVLTSNCEVYTVFEDICITPEPSLLPAATQKDIPL